MLQSSVFMCLVQTNQTPDRSSGIAGNEKIRTEASRPSCRQVGSSCLTDTNTYLLYATLKIKIGVVELRVTCTAKLFIFAKEYVSLKTSTDPYVCPKLSIKRYVCSKISM